jgi:hypothetical protein
MPGGSAWCHLVQWAEDTVDSDDGVGDTVGGTTVELAIDDTW